MKEILDFIQSIIASISWPITTIILVVILKKPISNAFNRLSKLKYKETELDFVTELRNAKEVAKSIEKGFDSSKRLNFSINRTLIEEIEQVASISPQASIPLSWSMVDSEITNLINRSAVSPDYPPLNSPWKNLELLRENNLIDKESFELINSLRRLRNETVHAHGKVRLSTNDAIEYARMAETLSKKLKAKNN
jgi:hypothetical protein